MNPHAANPSPIAERLPGEVLDSQEFHDFLHANPQFAASLKALQKTLRTTMEELTADAAGVLAQDTSRETVVAVNSGLAAGPMSVRSLQKQAIGRKDEAKHRTQTAQQLLIAAMTNALNPDWDPADASTYLPPEESLLLALL